MTKIILPYSCVVPSGQPRGRLLIRNLHQTKLKLTDGKMYEWEKMIIVKSKLLLLGTYGGTTGVEDKVYKISKRSR